MDAAENSPGPSLSRFRMVGSVMFVALWVAIAIFGFHRNQQLHLVGIPALAEELHRLQAPGGSVTRGDMGLVYKSSVMAVSQRYVSNRTVGELAPYFRSVFLAQGWGAAGTVRSSADSEYRFCKKDLLASLSIKNELVWPGVSEFAVRVESGDAAFVHCK